MPTSPQPLRIGLLRNALPNNATQLVAKLVSDDVPLPSKFECEARLTVTIKTLTEATSAANEWLALVISRDAYSIQRTDTKIQRDYVEKEEITERLFNQNSLQQQKVELAANIEAKNAVTKHLTDYQTTLESESAKYLAATGAISMFTYISTHSEGLPAAGDYGLFDAGGDPKRGSKAASDFLTSTNLSYGKMRLKNQIREAQAESELLSAVVPRVDATIANEAYLRKCASDRLSALGDKLNFLTDRLNGSDLYFQARFDAITSRYFSLTKRLAGQCNDVIEAFNTVYGTLAPSSLLDDIRNSCTFSPTEHGSELDPVDLAIRRLFDWFQAFAYKGTTSPLCLTWEGIVTPGQPIVVDLKFISPIPGKYLFRTRGVRISAPYLASGLPCSLTIASPSQSNQYFDTTQNSTPVPAQPSFVYLDEGVHIFQPNGQLSSFVGSKLFWNLSPFGDWTVTIKPKCPVAQLPQSIFLVFEVLCEMQG